MPSEPERFWAKVRKSRFCWEWTASKGEKGYGFFGLTRVNGRSRVVRAHKWAWEQENGPVPKGLVLDHVVCDNPSCVRPSHMRVTTSRKNTLRSTKAPAAINSRKARCPEGHPYEIYVYRGRPQRICRICTRTRTKEWKLAHSA